MTQLRMDMWPPGPLPPVRNVRCRLTVDGAGWVIRDPEAGTSFDYLPDQYALGELLRLDVADNPAVLDVLNTNGVLFGSSSLLPDLDAKGGPLIQLASAGEAALRWVRDRRRQLQPEARPKMAEFHVTEAALALTVAQVLQAQAVLHLEDADADPTDLWKDTGFTFVKSAEDAWGTWARTMNAGLSAIQARIEVDFDGLSHGETATYLFSVLCLQIRNFVAEGIPARSCANDRCHRLFVRQDGRAEKGQHRTTGGVIYCSRSCATAVAKRAWRARNAAANAAVKSGHRSMPDSTTDRSTR